MTERKTCDAGIERALVERGGGQRGSSQAAAHVAREAHTLEAAGLLLTLLSAGSRELSVDSAEVVGALWEGHVVARLRVFRHGLC